MNKKQKQLLLVGVVVASLLLIWAFNSKKVCETCGQYPCGCKIHAPPSQAPLGATDDCKEGVCSDDVPAPPIQFKPLPPQDISDKLFPDEEDHHSHISKPKVEVDETNYNRFKSTIPFRPFTKRNPVMSGPIKTSSEDGYNPQSQNVITLQGGMGATKI